MLIVVTRMAGGE